jgi:hypothetical protein
MDESKLHASPCRRVGSAGAQSPCWGTALCPALHRLSLCGSSTYVPPGGGLDDDVAPRGVCVWAVCVFGSTIVDPYLNLFRGIIPPIGGTLDLSPILAFVVLNVFTGCAHCHHPFVYPCVTTPLLHPALESRWGSLMYLRTTYAPTRDAYVAVFNVELRASGRAVYNDSYYLAPTRQWSNSTSTRRDCLILLRFVGINRTAAALPCEMPKDGDNRPLLRTGPSAAAQKYALRMQVRG